jgi:PTS system ascorbate-specific IIA component
MIGILIISHGNLGESLVESANHVMGKKLPDLAHIAIHPQDDPDVILSKAVESVRELDSGEGALVLSDICGATPCNIATRLAASTERVICLAGVNLPMLVRALTYRAEPLESVAEKALAGGRDGIFRISPS